MTRVFRGLAFGTLALAGLYFTVLVGMVLAGLIIGFTSGYRSSSRPSSAASSAGSVMRYVECDRVHPTPECVALAKRAAVASAH